MGKSIKSTAIGSQVKPLPISNPIHDIMTRGIGVGTDFILAGPSIRMHPGRPNGSASRPLQCRDWTSTTISLMRVLMIRLLPVRSVRKNIVPYGIPDGAQSSKVCVASFLKPSPGICARTPRRASASGGLETNAAFHLASNSAETSSLADKRHELALSRDSAHSESLRPVPVVAYSGPVHCH